MFFCTDYNNNETGCGRKTSGNYVGVDCKEKNCVSWIDYNGYRELCMDNTSCGYWNSNKEWKLYSDISSCSELSGIDKAHCESKTDCFYGSSNNCFDIKTESLKFVKRGRLDCVKNVDNGRRDKVCSYFDNDENKCLSNGIISCYFFIV
jgi:hypothetical protein